MRIRTVIAAGLVVAVVAVIGVWLAVRQVGEGLRLPFAGRSCVVRADGQVRLDADQMANAATIAAIGTQRKMPQQAVVVALATAYQESGLRNLDDGDRDSVGLFQQRPSQGWGTVEQVGDPRYATRKFYAALARVRGWERMRVTEAAQKVQRSAYPEAYQKWADESQVLTRALLGEGTGAVSCTVGSTPVLRGEAAAAALNRGLHLDWGLPAVTQTDLTGLAVPATDQRHGWRYAYWLVSHASDHGVKRVRFDGLEWTAQGGTWNRVANARSADRRVLAEVFSDA